MYASTKAGHLLSGTKLSDSIHEKRRACEPLRMKQVRDDSIAFETSGQFGMAGSLDSAEAKARGTQQLSPSATTNGEGCGDF